MLEKPFAIELAMPEKLKALAKPKMNTPTRSAPHICWNVLAKTAGRTCAQRGRATAEARSRISSHENRIEVPAIPGAQANTTAPGLPLIEETKPAAALKGMYLGSGDHGPVHSATTTTRIMNGAKPSQTSRLEAGGVDPPLGVGRRSGRSGTPP